MTLASLLAVCAGVASVAPDGRPLVEILKWEPHDFTFSDAGCDGFTRHPGLTATVTRPDGSRFTQHGFNHILLNVYAHDTRWRAGKTEPDDLGPPDLSPWAGSNADPDHSRLNPYFWRHYDRVIDALYRRGIVAHLMIKVYNKRVAWPDRGSPEDDLYFRTVLARYGAYPNVVWDFSKEAHNEKNLDYKLDRLRFIRRHDPYGRLVTVHDDDAANDSGVYDGLTDFRADQHHREDGLRDKILEQRKRREWPVANVEFGYEHGPLGPEDKTYGVVQSPERLVARAWQITMAGGYTAYYYTFTAWDVLRAEDTPVGYAYFRNLKEFFERTRYWELEPRDDVTGGRWTLARPGREYVVFVDTKDEFVAHVAEGPPLRGEWFDVLTGERIPIGVVTKGQRLRAPAAWIGPAVLHVRREGRHE